MLDDEDEDEGLCDIVGERKRQQSRAKAMRRNTVQVEEGFLYGHKLLREARDKR
jgi:hypothetical protein